MHLSEIDTPQVVIDRHRLNRNIACMQELATQVGVRLRPHVKTHKSIHIARKQLDAGAEGITTAKVDEALVFMTAGVSSVTVAYPLLSRYKLSRLLTAAKDRETDLNLIADSEQGLEALAEACAAVPFSVGVFLKIDVGLHRCGLREDDPRIESLAAGIERTPYLTFRGLLAHAGHAYGASDKAEVQGVACQEVEYLMRVRERLERVGVAVAEISVGSTPTVLAADDFTGITEIRPGNYVFLDRTPLRLGLITIRQVALTVIATVVSMNRDYIIIDCGSKVLSSDLGAHGTGQGLGFGLAFPLEGFADAAVENAWTITKLSEEHGFIPREDRNPRIGDRVRIIPNHACAVANLTNRYLVVEGEEAITEWPVDARGCVR